MAGVQICLVKSIFLDHEKSIDRGKMKIKKDVVLTDDVIASVKTSGLIEEEYIKIFPGKSDEVFKTGYMITETVSLLDMEELISKNVFGGA
jgi:phospholipid/cholesterol/gamma-HCH transport system substrate-binding protein